jgi:hypothetical protein
MNLHDLENLEAEDAAVPVISIYFVLAVRTPW